MLKKIDSTFEDDLQEALLPYRKINPFLLEIESIHFDHLKRFLKDKQQARVVYPNEWL
jgi:hypothetical protein